MRQCLILGLGNIPLWSAYIAADIAQHTGCTSQDFSYLLILLVGGGWLLYLLHYPELLKYRTELSGLTGDF